MSISKTKEFWTPLSIDRQRRAAFHDPFRNLCSPSIGLALFLIGMHLLYFLPLLIPATREDGPASGTYRFVVMAQLLILAGAFLETRNTGFWLLKRHPLWTAWGALSISVMTVTSLLGGGGLLEIITPQLAFFWMLFVPALALRMRNWPWLLLTFFLHTVFGCIYAVYEIFILGHATRDELLFSDNFQFVGTGVYATVFLLLLLPILRGKAFSCIAVGGFLIACLQSFFAAKRYPILLIPVQVLLFAYCANRTGYFRGSKLLGAGLILSVLMPMIYLMLDGQLGQNITGKTMLAQEQFMARMTSKGDINSTIAENERWDEARGAVGSMDFLDWVIGRGPVSENLAPGMINSYMVHNSFLNCFYWGGVPLFIFMMIPLVWVLRLLWNTHKPLGLACAAFLLSRYLTFPGYMLYTPGVEWLLFCIVMGHCAWSEAEPSESIKLGLTQKFQIRPSA